MNTKGFFVTFEGGEGSGKSTQAQMLDQYLLSHGFPVAYHSEPGYTEAGKLIREILMSGKATQLKTQMFLFLAARAELMPHIKAELETGQIVLCDRFEDSTYAYQGYGQGLSMVRLMEMNGYATEWRHPDHVFFMNIDPAIALKRKTDKNHYDSLDIEFHNRVFDGYHNIIATDRQRRYSVIDANRPVPEVHEEILQVFLGRYWSR